MAATTRERQAPVRHMQGTAVPESSVRPAEFFARTRRHITAEQSAKQFAGLGYSDTVTVKKSDILAALVVKVSLSVVVTLGGGTCASTARWPYDLIRQLRFTANGQSNIINCSGLKLRAREFMSKGDQSDRGVTNTIGGVARNQGTLARASEAWGFGSNTSAIAGGTYNVELEWFVPVAEDQVDLSGAIFAQTSSTDLDLVIDWETAANLFVTTGAATVAVTGTFMVTSIKYSIPYVEGAIVVPDLSLFHSLVQSRYANAVATGENEIRIVGQGPGKRLLRVFWQLYNGAPAAPVALNATNFGRQSYRYGSNETPDEFQDGRHLAQHVERTFNVDMGSLWGIGVHDFAAENAFRDTLDMGSASELRLVSTINSAVSLSNPAFEVVQETVYVAGQGA